MQEKVTYGIKNVHYALKYLSEAGTVTYGEPKRLPGASEIALPPVGDPVKVYADNVVYVKLNINQGYNGTLSIYNVPDHFARDVLGMIIDSNGVLIEDASAKQSDFALLGEFETDTIQKKRFLLYNCSAGRSDINGATKEDKLEAKAFSVPITASPLEDTEYVKASIVGDSANPTWSSWMSSVYTPHSAMQYKVSIAVSGIADALVVCGGKMARTDTNGNAYFMQASGTFDVMVSARGKTAQVTTVTVTAADVSKTITMV